MATKSDLNATHVQKGPVPLFSMFMSRTSSAAGDAKRIPTKASRRPFCRSVHMDFFASLGASPSNAILQATQRWPPREAADLWRAWTATEGEKVW